MTINFDGDVVVITGGAGGLGMAYARLLTQRGARIVINDTGGVVDGSGGNPDAARQAADEITSQGGIAIADDNDGATLDGAQSLIRHTLEEFGRVDAVIANAGILRDKTFQKVSDDDFFAVINAHLVGTARVFHAAYPHMVEQRYGRLVATTSAAGLFGNFGQTAYAAAKMGIVGLTKSLALEGASKNVKVNVIAPMASTRMTGGLADESFLRMADPNKVAALIPNLIHSSTEISGEIITVGLGRFARARLGVTNGIYSTEPDPEFVAANLAELLADDHFTFLDSVNDEMDLLLRVIGASTSGDVAAEGAGVGG